MTGTKQEEADKREKKITRSFVTVFLVTAAVLALFGYNIKQNRDTAKNAESAAISAKIAAQQAKVAANQAKAAAAAGKDARLKICVFTDDLGNRIENTKQFLRTHPGPFVLGDIPRQQILTQLDSQEKAYIALQAGEPCPK